MKAKKKTSVDVPAPVQQFIDTVLAVPLADIARPLAGFSWIYDKGDFIQWIPLFNRFDEFFDEFVKTRSDCTLKYDDAGQPDPSFPIQACLEVLRVTAVLLENCSSKHHYASYEHLCSLLAAPYPEVVTAALSALVAFLKKTHHANIRWHGHKQLNARLTAMAQSWGGKDEGLEMLACVSDDVRAIQPALAKATTLHFEFFREEASGEQTAGKVSIVVPCMDRLRESEQDICRELVRLFAVPEAQRFQLLTAVRRARGFGSLEGRRQLLACRLMALVVLVQSSPSPEELASVLASEADLVRELVSVVTAEASVPVGLRVLAIRSLAIQLSDRVRHTPILTAMNGGQGGSSGGVLSSLLHKSVAAFILSGCSGSSRVAAAGVSQTSSRTAVATPTAVVVATGPESAVAAPTAPPLAAPAGPPPPPAPITAPASAAASGSGGARARGVAAGAAAHASGGGGGGGVVHGGVGGGEVSLEFMDAVLSLVSSLVQSTAGLMALSDAGVMQALMPLLADTW
ncbi:hypothetical protein V8C86DRAFT_1303353 [Haematococcus lacustris]